MMDGDLHSLNASRSDSQTVPPSVVDSSSNVNTVNTNVHSSANNVNTSCLDSETVNMDISHSIDDDVLTTTVEDSKSLNELSIAPLSLDFVNVTGPKDCSTPILDAPRAEKATLWKVMSDVGHSITSSSFQALACGGDYSPALKASIWAKINELPSGMDLSLPPTTDSAFSLDDESRIV